MKKLYRSQNDKMLGGILGGFAEYTNTDSTFIRLIYILLTLILCVPFILFYIICWFVIPKNPHQVTKKQGKDAENDSDGSRPHAQAGETPEKPTEHVSHETTAE